MRPRFDQGEAVRVVRNVRNDGTYPGMDTGALLVRRGSVGYVRDLGVFLQDQIIYSVHFIETGRLVGCREAELQPAADPWTPSRFESRDRVSARLTLAQQGRVLVAPGEVGEVLRVLRGVPKPDGSPGEVAYHVLFASRCTVEVPESALDAIPELDPETTPDDPAPSTGPSRAASTCARQPAPGEQGVVESDAG